MKLPTLIKDKAIWLKEFDHWVTPYLEEIRDSEIFHKTITNIKEAIDLLGKVNKEFTVKDSESVDYIVEALIQGLLKKTSEERYTLVKSFCDLLFLMTGKSDNNFKCQFPIYLKEIKKVNSYPTFRGKKYTEVNDIPRVIKSENIALLIVQLEDAKDKNIEGSLDTLVLNRSITFTEKRLIQHYFEYILNQEIYLRSLKIFGSKYFELKKYGTEDDLLTPMVIAYVRGSASASGGHQPESILRDHMNSWGLKANEDYNKNDVKPIVTTSISDKKTRAYDFILPYNVKNWDNQIYIQSQFYAGDSGSVSHKNIDQTTASRTAVLKMNPSAKFVEYVDGGGYYGSLNGDLKKLLYMGNTENFFQVRSFPVKLRQMLQAIGFLTPLELVHALSICDFDLVKAKKNLINEGYDLDEINRVIKGVENNIIETSVDNKVNINCGFYKLSRRYFLLDCFACFGKNINVTSKGNILVPGYGEFYGAKASEILKQIQSKGGSYYDDWQNTPQLLAEDLEFLNEKEWVIVT
ncbi:MAG: hypothetical protein JST86_20550 [Bacteroidetes bacterium]|nr:hypothetical protein [Bacteroidota bacterium]